MTTETTDTASPKFIVLERSLIGNRVHEVGEEVTLPAGTLPAENLQATDAAGEALKAEYTRTNAERVAKMKADNADSAVGDPTLFAKKLGEELAKANAEAHDRIAAAVSEGIAQGIAKLIQTGVLAPATAKTAAKGGKGATADGDQA